MQWVLQRLMTLTGATDLPDTAPDESEDISVEYSEMEADDEEAVEDWSGRISDWIDESTRSGSSHR